MKSGYFVFAILALVMVNTGSSYTFAHMLERPPGPIKAEFNEPHEVIEIYLKAVSRGELIVFDRKLDKSMLIPLRVEYVYELNNPIPILKVYSELTQPIPVPAMESCEIRAVSSILDADGHIIETKAHIWTK